VSRARESATRSEAILDKKARQKAAAARKRSEKKQREGQSSGADVDAGAEWTGDAGAGSAGSATTEARGGRREGSRRRASPPAAGRGGGGDGVGRSLRRLLSASSQRPRGEKLRNPGGARTGGCPVSRFIVGSRSAVLRSCADSFRGRDEERSRTIGRRRRAPSLRPLSPPSTSARPPPPNPRRRAALARDVSTVSPSFSSPRALFASPRFAPSRARRARDRRERAARTSTRTGCSPR